MAVHHISKKTPRISIRGVLGQRIITAQSAALAAPQLCGIAVAVDERRHFDDCAVVALGFGTQRETVVVAGNGRLICCHGHFGFLIHRETPFNNLFWRVSRVFVSLSLRDEILQNRAETRRSQANFSRFHPARLCFRCVSADFRRKQKI